MLVPYDQLLQISKNCARDEQIQIEPGNEGTIIKFALADRMGESKVKPLAVDEFPQTPNLKGEAIPLTPELRRSLHEAMECVSTDSVRYVITGTFIDASNPKAHYIVGTDGKHLYSANSFALPLKQSLIIPDHKFLGWKEFNLDGEWQMKTEASMVQINSRRWTFITKTIEGSYPNWRQVMPKPEDAKTQITLDPEKLDVLIKLVQRMPCHEVVNQTVGLEWKEGQFLLLGKDNPNDSWLRVPVPGVKGEGPEMMILLDRRFLIKALQFGLNSISLIDEISPLRFHREGKQMIVMPVRPVTVGKSTKVESPPPAVPASVPVNPPPSAEQPEPNNTMPTTNGHQHDIATNGATTVPSKYSEAKPALETALVQIESIKTAFRESITALTKLGDSIRQALREQKSGDKDLQNVRQTLRSLQSVRI